ncbi:MAG: hypothetical protein JWM21_4631 [Acidobacteria bacterium]|nr:hypothetical protein [Acidobacteriota bacterium]
MIFRAARLTLHHILYAADGHDRDDEEKRNETHAGFLYEISDGAAMATTHLGRQRFRAPAEKVRTDDEEE